MSFLLIVDSQRAPRQCAQEQVDQGIQKGFEVVSPALFAAIVGIDWCENGRTQYEVVAVVELYMFLLSFVVHTNKDVCETKVYHVNSVFVGRQADHYVLRFDVSVDEPAGMQGL